MTKKHWIIAVVVAVAAGFLFLRGDREPPTPQKEKAGPEIQAPKEGAWPAQSWQRDTRPPPPSEDWNRGPALPPRYDYPSPRYAESFPPAVPMGQSPQEQFRFRPLNERERQRIERQAEGPYGSAPSQSQPWQPRATNPEPAYGGYPAERAPLGPTWDYPGWGTEGYSLRSAEPPAGTSNPWEGAYSRPMRPGEGYRPETSPLQAPPQWGAVPPERVPPSYRMYPSLDVPRDRRLTAR